MFNRWLLNFRLFTAELTIETFLFWGQQLNGSSRAGNKIDWKTFLCSLAIQNGWKFKSRMIIFNYNFLFFSGSKLHVCGAEIMQSFQSSLWADFLIRNYLRLPLKILNQAWHFIRDASIYIRSVFTRFCCCWYDLWVVIMISRSGADDWRVDSSVINLDIVACANVNEGKLFLNDVRLFNNEVLSANSWRKLLISAPTTWNSIHLQLWDEVVNRIPASTEHLTRLWSNGNFLKTRQGNKSL